MRAKVIAVIAVIAVKAVKAVKTAIALKIKATS